MTEIDKTNIKELVNIIGNAELSNKCHSDCFINTDFDNECSLCRAATALFKAGYRKQSDTVKELAEKINRKAEIECDSDFNISIYNLEALTETIAEQYGKEEDTI